MRTLDLTPTVTTPVLGQGTWFMGEKPALRDEEIASLRLGIELGLTLIDTATMYGDGAAEELVGDAVSGRRDEVALVTKVLPWEADVVGIRNSVRGSLERLGTDHVDVVLLHWNGGIPFEESIEGFEALVASGEIGAWGVSNLDPDEMGAFEGTACVTDQVLYNLARRGPELDLFPVLRERGMPIMAYSPVEQARLLRHPELLRIAGGAGLEPAVLALAWVVRTGDVLAIPKAGTREHVRANVEAASLVLDDDVLAALDAAFPAPPRPVPLQML